LVVLAWISGTHPIVIRSGATFLAVAIAIPSVSLAIHITSRSDDVPDSNGQLKMNRTRFKPNVYVFISDAYPRQDVLAKYFTFDNEPFLHELSTIGYLVRRDSISNYPTTYQSLASLVEMDFVSTPEMTPYKERRRFLRAITGQSAMVQRFRSNGYRFAQVTRRVSGGGCRGIEDICLDSEATIWNDTFAAGILRLTPLQPLIQSLALVTPVETLRDMRKRLELLPQNQPLIVFVHTLLPHEPIYDSSCNISPLAGKKDNLVKTDPEARAAYVATVRCVNMTILDMARWLDARDPGAIVIFLSDHGSDLTVNFYGPMSDWGAAQIGERFANFLAIRMPHECAALSSTARSLVNVMEVVFACIEGRDPKLRQDRVFVGVYENNQEFGHVREVTNFGALIK
jgi:hypothetical protein